MCPPHDGQVHHPPLDALSSLIAAGAGARVLMITDQGVPPLRGLTAPNILEGLGLQMTWDPTEGRGLGCQRSLRGALRHGNAAGAFTYTPRKERSCVADAPFYP